MRRELKYLSGAAAFPFLLHLAIFTVASAQTAEDAFNRGNESYRKGQYQEAAGEYASILKQGYSSAALYFNLGNAYYRMGNTGQAILSYERANRLRPNDPDVLYNLRLANFRALDRIDAVPELFLVQWLLFIAGAFSIEVTAAVFVIAWAVVFASLTVLYIFGQQSFADAVRWIILVSTICVVLFGVLLGIQRWQAASHNQAIVLGSVVTAKSSPDDQSQDAFVVHEGLKVRLSDSVSDWVKITLSDGKVGWIRSQQCERI